MPDLLTTDEAAAYLRLSERKLYELVANGAVPCSKATGRWLFPKSALDQWVMAGLRAETAAVAPPIVGGSHDPLLEWALRESGSGLASLPEGSESGLLRLSRGEVIAAAIHLHRHEGMKGGRAPSSGEPPDVASLRDDETANTDAVAHAPGLHSAVVIAFARREQGLLIVAGNPLGLSDIASVGRTRARLAVRPAGAGAQLLLLTLLAGADMTLADLQLCRPPCPTGPDIAQAIRAGRADCGIATRAVAQTAGLGFLPLAWEHFDLALRQRDYFLPGPQALFAFMRGRAFAERAAELGGYDVAASGAVRHVN
jgi:excisionase family DNA binding protein